MSSQDLGKVMVTPKGAWSSATAYEILDIVTNGGNAYLAKQDAPAGTALTNTSYWIKLVEKGDKGDTGTMSVGTVTTGEPGTNASVTNSGTSTAAIWDFVIPRGDTGVNTWGDITGDLEDQEDLKDALDAKADADEVYTKSETDALLDDKADADSVYTKSEADDLLALKADADSVYTKSEANALLAVKADADNVYTKAETDALLDEKADIIVTSASGPLVHITDAGAYPADILSAAIEPVQDLHGYDNPWPAGGGVNLMSAPDSFDTTTNGVRLKYNGNGQYSLSGTNTSSEPTAIEVEIPSVTLPSSDIYIHLRNNYSTSDIPLWFFNGTTQITGITFSAVNRISKLTALSGATVSKLRLTVPANYVISETITFQPSFELGSTATSWSPYSNVCPISGHSSATVTRTGKNILPMADTSMTTPQNITFTTTSAGTLSFSGTASDTTSCVISEFPLPAGSYKLNGLTDGSASTYRLRIRDKNDTSNSVWQDTSDAIITFAKDTTVQLQVFVFSGTTVNKTVYPMIRLASVSDATYEPYQGTSVTIALGEERFGGTLDVLTGILTVTYKEVPLTDIHYFSTGGEYLPRIRFTETAVNYGNGYCSHLPLNKNGVNAGTTIGFTVRDTYIIINLEGHTYATSSEATSALSAYITANPSFKIVYELATPVTVQLSPATLSLLKGENNLWSDTGDTSVTYLADTKLYIDGKLAAAIAELQALILENNE